MKAPGALRLFLVLLASTALACQTLTRSFDAPNPEGVATDVVTTETVTTAESATPLPATPEIATGPLRPEFAGDLSTITTASEYDITVTVEFNEDGSVTLAGNEVVRFTNPQSTPLDDVYLMLWPNNDDQYSGALQLGAMEVNGEPVTAEVRADELAARIPLPAALAPGERVEFTVDFTTTVEKSQGLGRFAVTEDGVLIAPTFYPLLPRLGDDGEWQTDPAPSGGDTTTSDAALYRLTVTAPAEYAIVASGTVVEASQSDGQQTQTLVSGPMRDLALTVGPLTLAQRDVEGVMVNAYMQSANRRYAEAVLDYAAGQIETLQELVGPYPYTELDVVDATGSYPGVEYPGLIYVGGYGEGEFFSTVVIHEVAHQWFYALIGNDQLREPWLDEAAASYAEVLYTERWDTAAAAEEYITYFSRAARSADDPEQPIGLPVAAYDGDYGAIVYAKGAVFFHTLRQEIGDEAFFDFLSRYYDENRYGFATGEEFQSIAEATCGCDLQTLFDVWVYEGGEVEWP